ncbi:hypothetical protein E8E15_000664 [Penicillium rubens]|nr:hypothetical protein E8E15_000664 [Penicillium rubens]KAJ5037734.1 hypothetical protein NUH16_011333 [Penicillium rubens]
MGRQKLNTLARELFDSLMLQPKLCAIAKEFHCARWHRQRQADQVGRQWYEAAVHNQTRVPHDSRLPSPSVMVHLGQRQISQDPPMLLSISSEPVQSINPFVTAEMLRTNSVPWHVSPTRPAILTSVANIWADVQDLTFRKLSLSEEVDNIQSKETGFLAFRGTHMHPMGPVDDISIYAACFMYILDKLDQNSREQESSQGQDVRSQL